MFKRIVLLLCLLWSSNVLAQTIVTDSARELYKKHPPVPISRFLPNRSLPRYKNIQLMDVEEKTFPDHLELTEYLGVKGPERDQGNCGSCWVWSGVGCLEAAFNKALKEGRISGANYVTNQKFSINFLEGKVRKYPELLQGFTSICDGGWPGSFVDLLSTPDGLNYLVPRDNWNADATFSGTIGDTTGAHDLEEIQLNPHVTLEKLELEEVVSDYNDKEKAKLEVIQALNDGHLVQMDFIVFFDFYEFWQRWDPSEDGQYRFKNSEHEGFLGGHAVVIVGYDISDPDPDKHYWIAQNSWGYDYAHPDGLFKVNIASTFGANRIMEYIIYKPTFKVDNETCDNTDNDCNTVVDDGCPDQCVNNDKKTLPGVCGCDKKDLDTDFDGVLDCLDGCPEDPNKTSPGICGCGYKDSGENIADDNGNGVINCQEKGFTRFKDIKFGYLNRGATDLCYDEESHRYVDFYINHLCAQTESNDLLCLGDNRWGQLGDNTKESHNYFTKIDLHNVTSFDLGRNHSCAVADSKVYCWGWNLAGELGRDNGYGIKDPWTCDGDGWCGLDTKTFILNPSESEFGIEQPTTVSCGFGSTCVTTAAGKAYCFGENRGGMFGVNGWLYPFRDYMLDKINNGEMCVPDTEDWKDLSGTYFYNGFMATVPLENISEMAMSYSETATISNGVLYNYGLHHDLKKYPVAARYKEFKDLTAVSKSETDLCAVNTNGELYCLDTYIPTTTEYNFVCAQPTFPRSDYPVQKIPLENVSLVGCGSSVFLYSMGSSPDKKEYERIAKEYAMYCKISDPDTNEKYEFDYPRNVDVDPESHVCAVSNGELYCWGRGNRYGQLGSDRTENLGIPTKVEGVSNVTALAVTGGANCYISNGELFCFGDLIPFGIDRQSPKPCKLTPPNTRPADFFRAGGACKYLGGGCGKYSYRNGNYICKPCSEPVEYGSSDGIPNCLDDLQKTEDPEVDPPQNECPQKIGLTIDAKKFGSKKIKVTMEEINKNCFSGTYVYQIRLLNKGKKIIYKTKNSTFTTKNLKKGSYKVSYRVMKQIKKKVKVKGKVKYKTVLKAVTNFSQKITVKLKK